MSRVDELLMEFERRGKQPVLSRDMVPVLQVLSAAAEWMHDDRQFVDALHERLLLVDELPEEAPYGALIRLKTGSIAARIPLYLGNGNGQPLTKLVPEVV